jgi:hypothetical protein
LSILTQESDIVGGANVFKKYHAPLRAHGIRADR